MTTTTARRTAREINSMSAQDWTLTFDESGRLVERFLSTDQPRRGLYAHTYRVSTSPFRRRLTWRQAHDNH